MDTIDVCTVLPQTHKELYLITTSMDKLFIVKYKTSMKWEKANVR